MLTIRIAAGSLRPAVAAGFGLVAGAIGALTAQRHIIDALRLRLEQLEQAAHNQHDANLAVQQRLHWELLSKAMDDEDLAEVLNTYEEDVTPQRHRQYLFANALYTNLLFYHRVGNIDRDEFFGFVRGIFQNPIVREYWNAGRHHRATIANGSDEAELGHLVDDLLRQLEEADIDEWWVIGEPPSRET
ncbi:hypothetical protein DCW30_27910 [Streptomyces alfalfae]|uniref:Secreted protein n=1 Tax=Streptomyces alfalfae TaxID=1642299 RepID=A0A1P8TED0_9ACTN|nr:DUF6082 family protein [Streptomyces alfalfae]AYA16337.1 hypothetical protein D3X13_08990 [Streptomyces fradiae]APY85971.1 hypothetical protein A7J05_09825 [Streptomyces alfalfae]QQC91791.1 hypothetical protein I8755_27865 [Streptomyces alfalfae]QUI34307.1 hypothetical protein H9W91_28245 [Streptomyces alfalfae]RXX38324.1 hypothetical protein DCW30_27910 [Streptomyces alfalfae]